MDASYEDDRVKVRVEGSPRPDDDIAASLRLTDELLSNGTQAWDARYRWFGPIKFMAYKEVGPPPWRWPRIGIQPNGRFVRLIVGWRSTAYALCILWAGRRQRV